MKRGVGEARGDLARGVGIVHGGECGGCGRRCRKVWGAGTVWGKCGGYVWVKVMRKGGGVFAAEVGTISLIVNSLITKLTSSLTS